MRIMKVYQPNNLTNIQKSCPRAIKLFLIRQSGGSEMSNLTGKKQWLFFEFFSYMPGPVEQRAKLRW